MDAAAETGTAFLIASTDYEQLAQICHRVFIFARGADRQGIERARTFPRNASPRNASGASAPSTSPRHRRPPHARVESQGNRVVRIRDDASDRTPFNWSRFAEAFALVGALHRAVRDLRMLRPTASCPGPCLDHARLAGRARLPDLRPDHPLTAGDSTLSVAATLTFSP